MRAQPVPGGISSDPPGDDAVTADAVTAPQGSAGGSEPVARPHPEPVVLEIGGDLGALIVYADGNLLDTPIEISPEGQDHKRAHQHVLERPLADRTVYAAVFDRISEGTYTLWMHDQARAVGVKIAGGNVTELDWSTTGEMTDRSSPDSN